MADLAGDTADARGLLGKGSMWLNYAEWAFLVLGFLFGFVGLLVIGLRLLVKGILRRRRWQVLLGTVVALVVLVARCNGTL